MNVNQNSEPAAEPGFRFCWLRENMPSHLEYDAGIVVPRQDLLLALLGLCPRQQQVPKDPEVTLSEVESLQLPDWAMRKALGMIGHSSNLRDWQMLAHKLRDLAANVPGLVDVYFPFLDRRAWTGRLAALDSTAYVLHGSSIMPKALVENYPLMSEYLSRWIGALSVTRSEGLPLRYVYTKRINGPIVNAGITREMTSSRSRPVELRAEFVLESSACAAWSQMPPESSAAYFPIAAKVSVAVQVALRKWLPVEWFDGVESFQDILSAYTVLAYSATRPFRGKKRVDFTYDTMDPDWLRSVFVRVRRPLQRLLFWVRPQLVACGVGRLSNYYYPAQAGYVIERVRRQRRFMHMLIDGEGDLVNRLLRFGVDVRGEESSRRAAHAAVQCSSVLNTQLRHSLNRRDCSLLGTILMFTATNAVHEALGGSPTLSETITLQPVRDERPALCA